MCYRQPLWNKLSNVKNFIIGKQLDLMHCLYIFMICEELIFLIPAYYTNLSANATDRADVP